MRDLTAYEKFYNENQKPTNGLDARQQNRKGTIEKTVAIFNGHHLVNG